MLKSKYDSPNKPIPGQRLLVHHCCMSDPKSIGGRIPIHCSWYFPVAEEGGILFSEASLSRKYPNFSLSEEPSVVHVLKFMFKNAYSSVIALVHHLFSSIYRFGFVPERICFHPFFQTQRRKINRFLQSRVWRPSSGAPKWLQEIVQTRVIGGLCRRFYGLNFMPSR